MARMMPGGAMPPGAAIKQERREALLDSARAAADGHALKATAGSTSAHESVVVLRVLSANVESAMNLLGVVWAQWRVAAWGLAVCVPRVWRT